MALFFTGYGRVACTTQVLTSIGKQTQSEIKGTLGDFATSFFTIGGVDRIAIDLLLLSEQGVCVRLSNSKTAGQ